MLTMTLGNIDVLSFELTSRYTGKEDPDSQRLFPTQQESPSSDENVQVTGINPAELFLQYMHRLVQIYQG